MKNLKIGIIKEGKIPVDHRVALTPTHCESLLKQYTHLDIVVEPSDIRCYNDEEYTNAGARLVSDLTDCDILFGVKEVPQDQLISDKKYLFFSHTLKKQAYNQPLLQTIVANKIQLIDYECLRNEQGRVVAFGRWAGIVGAYNAIWTFGKKFHGFEIKRANECFDLEALWEEFQRVKLPPMKIVVTGGGRVAQGGMEVLDGLNIKKVTSKQYLEEHFDHPVYCQVDTNEYTTRIDGTGYNHDEFFAKPEEYKSSFLPFTKCSDVFIASAYWDPKAPKLFTKEEAQADDFHIKVIADITCDIEGSVPTTIKATTIEDPVFDFDLSTWEEKPAFSGKSLLTVMSVDNLPCELPRDASISFGDQLLEYVAEELFVEEREIVYGASITTLKGDLNAPFEYLRDYLEGK